MSEYLTPFKIVEELDKYIIGQGEAKKSVAIALRNRWRRMNSADDIKGEIIPNNILMIGPTGVGKTEIARRLAHLADAPFIKVEASKFTEVGYVGRDVESMVRDLVEQSVNLVKAEKKKEIEVKARENANAIILDVLIPPVRKKSPDSTSQPALEDAEKKEGGNEEELNERTRERFREKLRNGELDDRKIELEVNAPTSQVHIMGPGGMEGFDGLQDMLSGMIPKKTKRRSLTVAEAREYLIEEESAKLIDMDAVTREALERASNSGMIFIDEIDKIASGAGKGSGPDVSREGVQRDLLPIVEGSTVNTKHGAIKTDHILFIAAGAFHVAKPSDLIPELQGRFPIRVELSSLTKDDFVKILSQPKNALTKQYAAMLAAEGVSLTFTDDAIEAIADIAFNVNQELENIGARRLHTIMSNILNDILFDVPDRIDEKDFVINGEFVRTKIQRISGKKDLSHYIL
ncbi:MAG: ATP-dependent protease ATPase subunit HslU [Bacteroidetes bacterium]|nr:ATP-dependent protease ATPase subunit HslU [Bacteroidota bacterium]MBP6722438.1 ATP-dependent protease ATPase subunit HslU [Bacteroidia bacterium]MBP8073969.1 ATP-dependent protease ATPase subunit HslU [Bacteroidia bacterium]